MGIIDKRANKRLSNIKAVFQFERTEYGVLNISNGGLLISCPEGFDSGVIERLEEREFDFKLIDAISKSEMYLKGKGIRFEKDDDQIKVVSIGISFDKYPKQRRYARTIAIGGGKGGVGKTILSTNLALSLAQTNSRSVVVFDGDFGNANCHTLLGITKVEKSLEDYFSENLPLSAIIQPTAYSNVRLVSGASNKIDGFSEQPQKRRKLFEEIRNIDCDYVLIDLGAGVGNETLDLYNFSDEKLVVVMPQFTSLENAYTFIKSAFILDLKSRKNLAAIYEENGYDLEALRDAVKKTPDDDEVRLEYDRLISSQSFRVIANYLTEEKDFVIVSNLQKIVKEYLDLDSSLGGRLSASKEVKSSVNKLTPFVALNADSSNSKELLVLAHKLDTEWRTRN